MKIGNKTVGEGKTYIIAEAGMNHGGTIERAKELIKAAAESGADAIKFQTYTADELVVKGTPRFWEFGEDEGRDQHQAYEAIPKLSYDDYPELIKYCKKLDIEFLSTPFSFEAATKLNEMGMKAFKIASSDMSTIPFLQHIAKFGKPILLSTGSATIDEVYEALSAIQRAGNNQVVLLQCTLKYPTEDKDANWSVLDTFRYFTVSREGRPPLAQAIGVSDHTLGVFPSLVAIARGAQVVEKHFTTDKGLTGNADHWLSVDPTELKEMVDGARRIEALLGSSEKKVLECEKETRLYDKRSIVSKVDIKADTVITPEMLTYKRPGTGIWPNRLTLE
jgi:N,N'-diacetyllegionaminate synthase